MTPPADAPSVPSRCSACPPAGFSRLADRTWRDPKELHSSALKMSWASNPKAQFLKHVFLCHLARAIQEGCTEYEATAVDLSQLPAQWEGFQQNKPNKIAEYTNELVKLRLLERRDQDTYRLPFRFVWSRA